MPQLLSEALKTQTLSRRYEAGFVAILYNHVPYAKPGAKLFCKTIQALNNNTFSWPYRH